MRKPTAHDYEMAVRMLHSGYLDYGSAIICLSIMKAFVIDEKVPVRSLYSFRHIQHDYKKHSQQLPH
jgi:hypothetical protein